VDCAPEEVTFTRRVFFVCQFRTKTSVSVFVSPPTRFVESDSKTTSAPLPEIAQYELPPWFAATPADETDTRRVTPLFRFVTKTSGLAFVSEAMRLVAPDWKATNVPSLEIPGAYP
jgi:hypothetical protein